MTTPAPSSTIEITRQLISRSYSAEEVASKARHIYQAVLRQSPRITTGNYQAVAAADLSLLFDLYDGQFFGGDLRRLLQAAGAPLSFDFSGRLTRSAGLTKRFQCKHAPTGSGLPTTRYEIVLSSSLLFQTFRDIDRTIHVNGVVCSDRLEATQRVFEHELLHLAEMLAWGDSNCGGERFKRLAWSYFAHPETRHDLITQQERARTKFDIRVGDRVSFEFEGRRHVGVVNRITQRATVLVESEEGTRYSDGKKYAKYYIPLPMLQKV